MSMYIKIDISQLRKADVIVTSGGGVASKVIRNGVGFVKNAAFKLI